LIHDLFLQYIWIKGWTLYCLIPAALNQKGLIILTAPIEQLVLIKTVKTWKAHGKHGSSLVDDTLSARDALGT
jgi:hypothetical protein